MKEVFNNPALSAYHRVALTPARPARTPAAPAATTASAPRPEAARVQISSQARELASSAAANNADRVDALKNAVQTGTYVVDPQRVAKGLLQR